MLPLRGLPTLALERTRGARYPPTLPPGPPPRRHGSQQTQKQGHHPPLRFDEWGARRSQGEGCRLRRQPRHDAQEWRFRAVPQHLHHQPSPHWHAPARLLKTCMPWLPRSSLRSSHTTRGCAAGSVEATDKGSGGCKKRQWKQRAQDTKKRHLVPRDTPEGPARRRPALLPLDPTPAARARAGRSASKAKKNRQPQQLKSLTMMMLTHSSASAAICGGENGIGLGAPRKVSTPQHP